MLLSPCASELLRDSSGVNSGRCKIPNLGQKNILMRVRDIIIDKELPPDILLSNSLKSRAGSREAAIMGRP